MKLKLYRGYLIKCCENGSYFIQKLNPKCRYDEKCNRTQTLEDAKAWIDLREI